MHPKFNFKFVCWYQPVYFWPCSHKTSFMGRQQQNNTPVLIQPYMTDYGPLPFMTNIEVASKRNTAFRKVLWTGEHLQLVLMSIGTGEDIGLEVHPGVDQFIRLEEGKGLVQMGPRKDEMEFERRVSKGDIIMIPAGTWHNLTNTGTVPIKLYTLYSPPEHRYATVHETKADAEEDEPHHPRYDSHN